MLNDEDRQEVQGLISESLNGLQEQLRELADKIPATPAIDTKEETPASTPEKVAEETVQPDIDVPPAKQQRYVRRGLRKVARNG